MLVLLEQVALETLATGTALRETKGLFGGAQLELESVAPSCLQRFLCADERARSGEGARSHSVDVTGQSDRQFQRLAPESAALRVQGERPVPRELVAEVELVPGLQLLLVGALRLQAPW